MKSHIRLWEANGTGPILVFHACMGPVPCVVVRPLWDRSRKEYGTSNYRKLQWIDNFQSNSPMRGSQRPMGPVPCLRPRYIWDRSHAFLSGTYGTHPKIPFFTGLSRHFSCMKSHARFWEVYGTSPIRVSHSCLGPVPCVDLRDLWDRSHKVYGTLK